MAAQAGWRDVAGYGERGAQAPAPQGPRNASPPGLHMSGEGGLDAAVKRLALALDALDAAVERRREADRNEDTLAAQVQLLGTDRARLADKLDAESALARELRDAGRDIAARLDKTIAEVQVLLEEGE